MTRTRSIVVPIVLLAIAAAVWFATGSRFGLVLGAILLQIAFTTDCVDGQLARYTRTFTKLGGWLDATFDRSKEFIIMAGLAPSRRTPPGQLLVNGVIARPAPPAGLGEAAR